MLSAKITSKGQITIPVEIRKKLGLLEGSYVTFAESGAGVIMTNSSSYAVGVQQQEFATASVASDGTAAYNAECESSIEKSLSHMSEEQRCSLLNALLGKSFADELEEWRRDFDVVDDGVSKILNRRSRELPNLKKVSKIWG
ncbi:MAG: AbrB/MazE/SpoVT family DNA-binding domain-containing protein [Fibrobacter sp.]|nr:AbrB/MazE/SpoVT family DNA-binding domain-containing protein [Fibrobacter sp.]